VVYFYHYHYQVVIVGGICAVMHSEVRVSSFMTINDLLKPILSSIGGLFFLFKAVNP